MKKYAFTFALSLVMTIVFGQQAILTISNTSNSSTLSCFTPDINLIATVSPSNFPLTYTWVSQNINYNGAIVTIASPGIYTTTAFNTSNNFSVSQTYTISASGNTFVPNVSIGVGFNLGITCTTPSVTLSGSGTTGIPLNSGFSHSLPVVCTLWAGPSPQSPLPNVCNYIAYAPGVYTLIVTDQNNGCSTSAVKVVNDNRIYPLTNSGSPFNVLCPNPTVVIYPVVINSSTGYTYSWTPPSGAAVSSLNAYQITVNSPGTYIVVITNTINGCATNTYIEVQVCVGLFKNSMVDFKIYPNPTHGNFSIQLKEGESKTIQIYDTNGRLVKQQTISDKNPIVNTSDLPDAIYFIKLSTDSQPSGYIKLVKCASN